MTTIKTLISTVVLVAASTVFAQNCDSCFCFPKGEDGPGVIGKRYAGASIGFEDVSGTSKNLLKTGLSGNLPLCSRLDLGGSLGYSTIEQNNVKTDLTSIGGSARIYDVIEDGIKPFVSAGLGYTTGKEFGRSTNWATWNLAAGFEIPYTWISVIPSVRYEDDFRASPKSHAYLVYSMEINSWITPKVSVYGALSYLDQQHSGNSSVGLNLGARYRF